MEFTLCVIPWTAPDRSISAIPLTTSSPATTAPTSPPPPPAPRWSSLSPTGTSADWSPFWRCGRGPQEGRPPRRGQTGDRCRSCGWGRWDDGRRVGLEGGQVRGRCTRYDPLWSWRWLWCQLCVNNNKYSVNGESQFSNLRVRYELYMNCHLILLRSWRALFKTKMALPSQRIWSIHKPVP